MIVPAPDSSVWFKSSFSAGENDCVEIADTPATIHVRDSKDKTGPTLAFEPGEWKVFAAFAAQMDI